MDLEHAKKVAAAIEDATGWNVSGLAEDLLKQVRENAADTDRDPLDEWQDCGSDLLRDEVYYSVMSRDPANVAIVTEAVRSLVEAHLSGEGAHGGG